MAKSFTVEARWDGEAEVWISQSDIPGLVIETETLSEFEDLVRHFAPELLATNCGLHDEQVSIEVVTRRSVELAVA